MTTAQHKIPLFPAKFLFWLSFSGSRRRTARKHAYLDARELSPHLKRDLGLLDGNGPYRRGR